MLRSAQLSSRIARNALRSAEASCGEPSSVTLAAMRRTGTARFASESLRSTHASTSTLGKAQARGFSSSRIARNASAEKDLVADPEHPSGIYYHKLGEGRYAMSFFQDRPSSPSAPSVMGIVTRPADAQGDTATMPIYDLAVKLPDCVETNEAFIELLHKVLKEEGVPQDGLIEYEAVLRTSGWAHVNDQRHPLMPGRIPTPENIIAMVAFIDGQVDFDSYQPNDTYRLVTGEEGVMQLRPNWLDLVKKRCRNHM